MNYYQRLNSFSQLLLYTTYEITFLSTYANFKKVIIATLALGLQPRQGVARLRAKREA
jgi:hypothetical protein